MPSFVSHPLEQGTPPPWASAWGDSEYGPWVAFKVEKVEYLLHWIPPGTFMMGSPEDEPGRFDNETLHEVTISKGFWMGETAVTQALWMAVMGKDNNPSRFKDLRRPVENVSWEDTQMFLEALEAKQPGLHMSLPTEAQWEYACRAGTEDATYAGPIELLGERNAPVLDLIAWYGGNSGHEYDLEEGEDSSSWSEKQYDHKHAGTRRVKKRLKNPWGLNDMLGNVWEWCQDWYGPYDVASRIDPTGPSKGVSRVLRGVSWDDSALDVRAACRYHSAPASRYSNCGLRLSRGQ